MLISFRAVVSQW